MTLFHIILSTFVSKWQKFSMSDLHDGVAPWPREPDANWTVFRANEKGNPHYCYAKDRVVPHSCGSVCKDVGNEICLLLLSVWQRELQQRYKEKSRAAGREVHVYLYLVMANVEMIHCSAEDRLQIWAFGWNEPVIWRRKNKHWGLKDARNMFSRLNIQFPVGVNTSRRGKHRDDSSRLRSITRLLTPDSCTTLAVTWTDVSCLANTQETSKTCMKLTGSKAVKALAWSDFHDADRIL